MRQSTELVPGVVDINGSSGDVLFLPHAVGIPSTCTVISGCLLNFRRDWAWDQPETYGTHTQDCCLYLAFFWELEVALKHLGIYWCLDNLCERSVQVDVASDG